MAGNQPTRKCKECKKEFPVYRSWQIFCSTACRVKNWRENHPTLKPEELAEIKRKLNIK